MNSLHWIVFRLCRPTAICETSKQVSHDLRVGLSTTAQTWWWWKWSTSWIWMSTRDVNSTTVTAYRNWMPSLQFDNPVCCKFAASVDLNMNRTYEARFSGTTSFSPKAGGAGLGWNGLRILREGCCKRESSTGQRNHADTTFLHMVGTAG